MASKSKSPRVYTRPPVFFKNYDLYETEGVNGPAKQGPGTGFFSNIHKYKSVSDFLKKKRNRKNRKRKLALLAFAADKNNIDFIDDESVNTIPYEEVLQIGLLDNINPELTDKDGHPISKLYYGTEDSPDPIKFNPFGIQDGNERVIDEEPAETKNLYYGISNTEKCFKPTGVILP